MKERGLSEGYLLWQSIIKGELGAVRLCGMHSYSGAENGRKCAVYFKEENRETEIT